MARRPMPAGAPRRSPDQTGRAAEVAARAWLEQHGLRCIVANFRARVGELDLVMQDGEHVAIVEVRHRTRSGYGGAAASVHAAKQRRIIAAAGLLLAARPRLAAARIRFDVVAVEGDEPAWQFEWIRDAFRAW